MPKKKQTTAAEATAKFKKTQKLKNSTWTAVKWYFALRQTQSTDADVDDDDDDDSNESSKSNKSGSVAWQLPTSLVAVLKRQQQLLMLLVCFSATVGCIFGFYPKCKQPIKVNIHQPQANWWGKLCNL